MSEKMWMTLLVFGLVGCMAVEEDFRVQHEGVLTGNVTVSEDEPGVTAPSPSRQIDVQSGEIPSLLSEFDAARIYREYVDYIFTSTGGREGTADNFGERG